MRFHAFTAGGASSIPGQGTKIPHAVRCGQKSKQNKTKTKKETKRLTVNREVKARARDVGVITMVLDTSVVKGRQAENRGMFLGPAQHTQPAMSTCSDIRQVWV